MKKINYRTIVKASSGKFILKNGEVWTTAENAGGKIMGASASGIWNEMSNGETSTRVYKRDVMKVNPSAAMAIFNGGDWQLEGDNR